MAKAVHRPDNIDIASLRARQVKESNLMQPGAGTAWEDRGAMGIVKAFIVTCIKSMISPGSQWDQIRRLENTKDASTLTIGCGILAAISWVVQSLWFAGPWGDAPMRVKGEPNWDVDWQTWGIGAALQLALAVVGMVVLLKIANALYQKLLPHAVAPKIPAALTYNILAYSLGPVLLVFIPVVGWLIALAWVGCLFIVAGIRRLNLSAGTAIINGILTVVITASIGAAAYAVGDLVWEKVVWESILTPTVTYTPPHVPGTPLP